MECTKGEWPCEMSTYIAWVEKVNAVLLEACKAVLEVHDEPCRYDHHGLCQAHYLRTNENGEPECEVGLLRAAIKVAHG